jgi:hypothetical protein
VDYQSEFEQDIEYQATEQGISAADEDKLEDD